MDDHACLRAFAETGSEEAFRALVDRHIRLVYSVARQTAHDPRLAEEVTQSVFLVLARKAGSVRRVRVLSSWLYRVTHLTALQAVRQECRRREREEKFAQMDHTSPAEAWEQLAPHLGELMSELGEPDRAALVLRFLESKSFKEVALAMDASEDAARMRVQRALDKLRGLFAKRGVLVPATLLAATLSAHATQAVPAGLAASAASAALLPPATAGSWAILKGGLELMASSKTVIATATMVTLILAGTAALVVKRQSLIVIDDDTASRVIASLSGNELDKAPPMIFLKAVPASERAGLVGTAAERMMGKSVGLKSVAAWAYAITPARITGPATLTNQNYDFLVSLPTNQREALKSLIAEKTRLTGRRETREEEVYVLRKAGGPTTGLRIARMAGPRRSQMRQDSYLGANVSMSSLAEALENRLGRPVLDETGLTGQYDLEFSWGEEMEPEQTRASLIDSLKAQAGLTLTGDKRAVEMLVMEPAGAK